MTKHTIKSKLAHGLPKIEFTNKAIDNFKSDKDCEVSFNTTGSTLKVLKLRYRCKTGKKSIRLTIWFAKKTYSQQWEYKKDIFGVSEVEDEMMKLKNHKDKHGYWERNPNKELLTEGAIKYSQKMTIRKVIEMICEANFPRAKVGGKIASHSQTAFTRFLMGYNHRRDCLLFSDDQNGWGKITFKP